MILNANIFTITQKNKTILVQWLPTGSNFFMILHLLYLVIECLFQSLSLLLAPHTRVRHWKHKRLIR